MTVMTKSMTHFSSAADGYIKLEATARGLANELFEGLKALATEVEKENLLAEFDKAMIDLEIAHKKELVELTNDKDMTLTKHSSAFKVRKSELRKGLKNNLNPLDFESFSKYRKGVDTATNGNATGSTGAPNSTGSTIGGGSSSEGGDSTPGTSKLHSVTNGFDKAVQDKLNLLVKQMGELDTIGQMEFLGSATGMLHKLTKLGGRWSKADAKTG